MRERTATVRLYKLGYTTKTPELRRQDLDEQRTAAGDIGAFELVHSIAIKAGFDTEQALFDAIGELRITPLREYFFGDEAMMVKALDAAAGLNDGTADKLNEFLASDTWRNRASVPRARVSACLIPDRPSPGGGWIFVCQNFWHRDNTFKVVCTKEQP